MGHVSKVEEIEAEIAATKARIGVHLGGLKRQLLPAELVRNAAYTGLEAARRIPKATLFTATLVGAAALGSFALFLRIRASKHRPPAITRGS